MESLMRKLVENTKIVIENFCTNGMPFCKFSLTHSDLWTASYKVGYGKNWQTVLFSVSSDVETALKFLLDKVNALE